MNKSFSNIRKLSHYTSSSSTHNASNEKVSTLVLAVAATGLVTITDTSNKNSNGKIRLEESFSTSWKKDEFSELQKDWEEFAIDSLNFRDDDEDDDEEEEESDDSEDQDDNEEESVEKDKENSEEDMDSLEEDDYSDLPEEDEPTTCSICLINRQGPCRNPWRRFEKCIKDNPDDNENKGDDDDILSSTSSTLLDKCSKVSFIWFNCLDKHRVTYTMITNKQYQPELEAMEEKYKANKKTFDNPPTFDISHYQEYQLAMYEKQQEEDCIEEEMMMDPSKPENFVSGYVYFNLYLKENEIDVAYIKDQDDTILGFDHFSHDKKEAVGDDSKKGELIFHIPMNTSSLTACALYKKKHDGSDDGVKEKDEKAMKEEEKVDDGILYHFTISNLVPSKEMDDD